MRACYQGDLRRHEKIKEGMVITFLFPALRGHPFFFFFEPLHISRLRNRGSVRVGVGARMFGRPDARTPGRSDARAFGCPGVQTPGRPDVRIRTSGRPDARTPTLLFFQFLRSSRRGPEPGRAVEPAAPCRRGAGPRRDERKNCEKRTKNERKTNENEILDKQH